MPGHVQGRRLLVITALAGVGIAVTLYGLYATWRLRTEGVLQPSLCAMSSWMDCRAAIASKHAYLAGIPLSWIGFLYYAWCAIAAVLSLLAPTLRRGAWRALFFTSLIALAVSVVNAFLLVTRIRILCPTCLVLYAVNLAMVVVAAWALGVTPRAASRWVAEQVRLVAGRLTSLAGPGRTWLFLGLLIVVFLAGITTFVLWEDATVSSVEIRKLEALAEFFRRPVHTLDVPADAPAQGPDTAPVDLIVFSDFQCGFCRRVYGVVRPYAGAVRLRFLHFPLDGELNPHLAIPGHELSGIAATASAVAHREELFWEFHDHLFAHQSNLDEETIRAWFRARGWSEDRITNALHDAEAQAAVRRHVELGHAQRLRGTPTLYVNGRRMSGWNGTMLDLLLRQELKAAGLPVDAGLSASR